MLVGLLKCPKDRLESEWHPRVPWPRYSRKLTFWHSRPHPYSYWLEFWTEASIQDLSEGVDLWPKLSNPEVTGEK